jgi:hypothetical protein
MRLAAKKWPFVYSLMADNEQSPDGFFDVYLDAPASRCWALWHRVCCMNCTAAARHPPAIVLFAPRKGRPFFGDLS